MQMLDGEYVAQLISRLDAIPDDARPRWGRLDRAGLIRHLIWTFHACMGKVPAWPFLGNWFTVHVLGPLLLRGIVPLPRNVRPPRHIRMRADFTMEHPGDLATLRETLKEYLALVQAGALDPRPHPVLGKLTVDQWAVFHVRHCEHHCKQFGV